MSGTKEGGKKAAATNKQKHGSDFYSRIGAIGGSRGHTGGFYANRDLARIAGAKGGKLSKRSRPDGTKNGLTIGELHDAHMRFLADKEAISG